jgi:hypothetical protein
MRLFGHIHADFLGVIVLSNIITDRIQIIMIGLLSRGR